jgi:predicted ATPase
MKLDYLWIKDFRNLKDFEIDFDETSPVTVLIGWNGTGKSNLLEALVLIFRNLDLGVPSPFAYRLRYFCKGCRVQVESDPEASLRQDRLRFCVEPVTAALGVCPSKPELRDVLPDFLFGYYSGPTQRLKEHFALHRRRYYLEIIRSNPSQDGFYTSLKSLRRLFHAEQHHSKYALLAFLCYNPEETQELLRKYLHVEGIEHVLFIMKRPPWAGQRRDEHLWGASGLVRDFLDRLFALALAPMTLDQKVAVTYKKIATETRLYLYLKDLMAVQQLAQTYPDHNEFFAALESADISEVIHDVCLRIRVRHVDGGVTFRNLSEGEQQLLMVLGLLRFTRRGESLILLDEPDTHLNPQWAIDFIQMLKEYSLGKEIGEPETSSTHLMFATHNPLAISGLSERQVQILTRDEDTGRIKVHTPDISPVGLGVAGVLRVMFDLESSLDRQTEEKLRKRHELYGKRDRTPEEDTELQNLSEELARLGFMREFRDPTYGRFVRAMAEQKAFETTPVSPEAMRQQEELARKAAEQIVAEEKT